MDNILEVKHIEKYYGSSQENITKALDDISFNIPKGDFLGIMGSSGSGKTTLLNCIATVDEISAGSVLLDGINLSEINKTEIAKFRRAYLGFIFQDYNLLDTMTLGENISLPLVIGGVEASQIEKRVANLASRLGIDKILNQFPVEVSGGQKQRCACARALITKPKLIVADEPTGALDSKASQVLMDSLKQMNEELEATIMIVTHDPFVASYCKRILFLEDGKIYNELYAEEKQRAVFYHNILNVLSVMGGV